MLQLIRDRAQGVLIWTIVGLIIITFALFGLSSYLSGSSTNYVASVNSVEIKEPEFRRETQRIEQKLGKEYRPEFSRFVKAQAIDRLVMRELLNQYQKDERFYVSDSSVLSELNKDESFKGTDGKFDSVRYREILSQSGMSPAMYEQEIGFLLAKSYLESGITRSEFTTASEVDNLRRLRNQQRDMGYLVINRSEYLKTAQASSQEVEAYYNDHRQEFMNPEQVRVEYVELKLEEMAARYPVSEQDIEKKYQAERNSYVINKEQRRAGHILIIVDKKTTEEAAKQKIAGILKEVKAGKDFAKLAKQHSQDPGSAKKGGDLGFFGRNVMDKAFEESAFSLKKGSVSEPVRSKYGYHLIKLTDIKPEKVKPLQAVREQIKKSLQIQQAQSDFGTDTSKLDLLSFEKPDSLSPVVEELGLTIKTSGFFTRQGGTGIAADPRVVQAAFSEEVLTGGKNSKMLELGEHALVLRIKEHKPASQRSLQEVTPLLQTRLKTQAAAAMVKETSDKVLARLQGGESPEQVVKSIKGAKWVKTGPIFRSAELDTVPLAKQVPHEIRRFGFTLPKPDAGKTSWGNTATGTGDGVVVGLFAVQVSDTKADKAKQQQEVLALTNFQGRAMLDHLLKQLHKDAKISINLPKDE